MTATEVLKQLKSLGKPNYAAIYKRHGMVGEIYGVSFADQNKIAKQIKRDHSLARDLWTSGNADARNLATLIADPAEFTVKEAEKWSKQLTNRSDSLLAANLIGRSPHARAIGEKWIESDKEFIESTGWMVMGHVASLNKDLPDSYFEKLLKRISRDLQKSKNFVRYSMNGTLINIGVRNSHLQKLALDAAKKIGEVVVDHGETACKTPDAAAYINKTVAHKKAKAAKARSK